MSECVIYLPRCNTKEIREAGREVLDWDLRVIDSLSEGIEESGLPYLGTNPYHLDARNKFLVHPNRLSGTVRMGWQKSLASLVRMLDRANIMKNPEKTDRKLGEFLEPIDSLDSTYAAQNFLAEAKKRVGYLASDRGQAALDTLRWAAYSYVETRVLERAVYDSVYLTKPGTYFRFSLS